MNNLNAAYWIAHLNLQPHPEGGFYKEVFRSGIAVSRASLVKQACTSIYYLLEGKDYSGFHRLASDEIWYFHKGAALHIHAINEDGNYTRYELSDSSTGNLSIVIEAGIWFAAEIPSGDGFTLVSCAVAPGFEFAEFEMAEHDILITRYPQHAELLKRLCRK
jgi:predicted cupin superfamily sugar epimerase